MTRGAMSTSATAAKLAVIAVVAAAVMLGAAAAARADATQTISFGGHVRGEAAFFEDIDGESFRICDLYRDNLPVVVRFSYIRKNGTRQTGAHWHKTGVDGLGNRGVRGCSAASHNFGEGRRVWYQACVGHAGGALTCNDVEVTTA
jgi:hypothetical protein